MKGKGQYVRQYDKTVPELENTAPAVLTRLKFWETDRIFKCPLIGMCLTLEEQKKLLKKTTFAVKKASSFAIHEALVSCADSENHLSRRVDILMNRKFGEVESTLRDLEPSEFVERFKTAFESGDYEAHLWAAAVHPDLPDKAKREIFGEFHMTMHFNAEDRANVQRKWYLQKTETDDLRVKLETEIRFRRSVQKENERLQRQISDLVSELAVSAKEKERLEEEIVGKRTAECVRELDSERQQLASELERMAAEVEERKKKRGDSGEGKQAAGGGDRFSERSQRALQGRDQRDIRRFHRPESLQFPMPRVRPVPETRPDRGRINQNGSFVPGTDREQRRRLRVPRRLYEKRGETTRIAPPTRGRRHLPGHLQ